MKIEIKIPKMGESIVEAHIGQIMKPTGSVVQADEEILEIETEKVNQVISAPAAGKVELTVSEGDTVSVDQIIGSIDSEAAAASPPLKEKPPERSSEPQKPSPQKSEMPPARKSIDDSIAEMKKPKEAALPPLSLIHI